MKVYLVWTGYEDVGAVCATEASAEAWIESYIKRYPTYGAGRPRVRYDFSIIEMEVLP